jgi:hypothetical protein
MRVHLAQAPILLSRALGGDHSHQASHRGILLLGRNYGRVPAELATLMTNGFPWDPATLP